MASDILVPGGKGTGRPPGENDLPFPAARRLPGQGAFTNGTR